MAVSKIHNFDIPDRILKAASLQREVDDLANEIADNVRSAGVKVEGIPGDIALPVEVSSYETDRSRATVWLAHPSGAATQAKHGLLTRAASAAGKRVKGS